MTETLEELEGKSPEELADLVETESAKSGGDRPTLLDRFSVREVVFSKPFTWCGKTYDRASLDFSKLTGRDIEAVEEELGGDVPAWPANSHKYQKLLAAKASGIPSDVLTNLPAADYNAVTSAARYFLLASG